MEKFCAKCQRDGTLSYRECACPESESERDVCRVKGCGTRVVFERAYLCYRHDSLWLTSPERKRMLNGPSAAQSAIVDFITRVNAEQDAAKDASPTASSASATTSG